MLLFGIINFKLCLFNLLGTLVPTEQLFQMESLVFDLFVCVCTRVIPILPTGEGKPSSTSGGGCTIFLADVSLRILLKNAIKLL